MNMDIMQRPQTGEGFNIFKTVEEVIEHAQKTIPSDEVLIQMADGNGVKAGEYFTNLNKISNMLVDLGMKKGSNVGVFLPNCIEYSYLYNAFGRLGIIIVPINQFLKGESLLHIINQSEMEFIITTNELYSTEILPNTNSFNRLKTVIFLGEKAASTDFNTGSLADFGPYPSSFRQPWRVWGKDVQGIWFTSGTTGLPKGVVVNQESMLYRTSYFTNYFRLDPSDVIYFVLPMYHIPYFCWGITMAMAAGCRIVNVNWFSASNFWRHVVNYNATVVFSTGTIIPIVLKQKPGEDEAKGKNIIKMWAGWPVDEPSVVMARWPKIRFLEAYGQTEYPLASITSYDNPELGSAGPLTPFTEIKISDPETGEEVLPGETGEIAMRCKLGSDYMMLGYYKSPQETERTLRNGWCFSGDIGYMDDRGLLHFVDRYKDSIRVGGENIPSLEVEAIIRKNPKIEEAAIVGIPGDLGHKEIVAHVVMKEGEELSPKDFFEFCKSEMAYYMIPRHLYFRNELPKNAMLKLLKYKLREEGLPPGSIDRKHFLEKTK